jgi:hypothetical protein
VVLKLYKFRSLKKHWFDTKAGDFIIKTNSSWPISLHQFKKIGISEPKKFRRGIKTPVLRLNAAFKSKKMTEAKYT